MVPVTQRSEVNDQSVLLYYNTLPEVKAKKGKVSFVHRLGNCSPSRPACYSGV